MKNKVWCAALGISCLYSAAGYAVDVNSGDYDALPAGSNIAALYLQYSESNDYYQQHQRQDGYARTEMSILRLIHYTTIGGMVVDPQILLPFGSVRNASVGGQSLGVPPVSATRLSGHILGGQSAAGGLCGALCRDNPVSHAALGKI